MNQYMLDRPAALPTISDEFSRREFLTGLIAAGLLTVCGNRAPSEDVTARLCRLAVFP